MKTTIRLPSRNKSTLEQVVHICQELSGAGGYEALIVVLMAKDKATRHKKRVPPSTRVDLVRDGQRVRGGKAFVNMHNEQIEYIELSAEDEKHLAASKQKAKALFRGRGA